MQKMLVEEVEVDMVDKMKMMKKDKKRLGENWIKNLKHG